MCVIVVDWPLFPYCPYNLLPSSPSFLLPCSLSPFHSLHFTTSLMSFDSEFHQKKIEEARLQAIRWASWKREQVEAEARAREWDAYWENRRKDDDDLWRDKDFANAVDKASRAGYKGQHGNYDVPEAMKVELDALYMQVTVGDYDGNNELRCAREWEKLRGKTRIESQRAYIKATNRMLSRYGWNPPEGWN